MELSDLNDSFLDLFIIGPPGIDEIIIKVFNKQPRTRQAYSQIRERYLIEGVDYVRGKKSGAPVMYSISRNHWCDTVIFKLKN